MTTIGKLWTAGIAYVALAVGAGLSIMYNILDTMQVRGPQFDWADLVTAVAAPAIVLLMVEMFVSRIWLGQDWRVQIIRWLATVAIGGVAMRTSWTHGHDFMASRGQSADVATLWPLAIDLLAIMATALILAGRTRGHVATVATGHEMATDEMATDEMATDEMATDEMATDEMAVAEWPDGGAHVAMAAREAGLQNASEDLATATQPLSEEYAATLAAELDAWGDSEPAKPVMTKVPIGAAERIRTMADNGSAGKDIDAVLAAEYGKSARTVRRWRAVTLNELISPA